MPKKKKISHDKVTWSGSSKSIQAIQEAFSFNSEVPDGVRQLACEREISPSDMCRVILELPIKEKKSGGRRLTVSFKPEDYEVLAKRWDIPPDAREAIRTRIKAEIEAYYYKNIDLKK